MVQILYPYTAGGHLGSALGEGLQKGIPEGVQRGLFSAALSGAAKAASDPNLTDQERVAKVMQALSWSPEATKFAFGKGGIMGRGGALGGSLGGMLGGTPGRTVGGGGAGEEDIFAPGAAVPGTSFTQGGWLGQQMEFGDQAAFDKYFPKKPGTSITGREFTEGDVQAAQEQMARAGYSNERIARLTARAQSMSTQAQKQKNVLFSKFDDRINRYNQEMAAINQEKEEIRRLDSGDPGSNREIINDVMRNRMKNWALKEAEKEFTPNMTREQQEDLISSKTNQIFDSFLNASDASANWLGRFFGVQEKRFKQIKSSMETLGDVIGQQELENILGRQGLSYADARKLASPPSEEEALRRENFIKSTGRKKLPVGLSALNAFAMEHTMPGGIKKALSAKETMQKAGEDMEKLKTFFQDLPRDANLVDTRSWAVSHGFDPAKGEFFADLIKDAIIKKYGSLTAKQQLDYDYMKLYPTEYSVLDMANDKNALKRLYLDLTIKGR